MTEFLKSENVPEHLSDESKGIWRQITTTWVFEPDSLLVLRVGLEAFDRLQMARRTLDAEGLTVKSITAHGETKILKHPAIETEKNARSGFLQAIRLLGLQTSDNPKNLENIKAYSWREHR